MSDRAGIALERIVRHPDGSFVPGFAVVHLWARSDPTQLSQRWNALFHSTGIAARLETEVGRDGTTHGWAETTPFASLRHIQALLAEPDDVPWASAALEQVADQHARGRYDVYRRIAAIRQWPAFSRLAGGIPIVFVGMGRLAAQLTMNVSSAVSSALVHCGTNKLYSADYLAIHGVPQPEYAPCASADAAVREARRVGYPVALKRRSGGNSDSVILNIADDESCRAAFAELSHGEPVLLQKMLTGIEYRVHVVNGAIRHVFRAEPWSVVGNGVDTLADLLRAARPRWLELAEADRYHARRLVYQVWHLGVRKLGDLARIVPPPGLRVRVSAATGEKMPEQSRDVIHRADRELLESFLRMHGSPSGGLDLILARPGERLANGGGVLELNIPSGLSYLNERLPGIADEELVALVSSIPRFAASGGRVPLWIADPAEVSPSSRAFRALRSSFLDRWPDGHVGSLDEGAGWAPTLLGVHASAYLLLVGDRAVETCGFPAHTRPLLFTARSVSELTAEAPHLYRGCLEAGGRLRRRRW